MLPKAPTAASGVRKLGISASLRMLRAAFTVVSPIQHDKSGLPMVFFSSARAVATADASLPALGE